MQIQKAELVISAPDRHSWPESELPELVLAGRSNVGKSSFINALTGRKKLAYVGNTPGKTRLLNFFRLDDFCMLVDVPGYGFAKLSKAQLMKFASMMEDYFTYRTQKKGLLMLVDARHLPSDDDMSMLEYARYYNIPVCIIATKIDKVKPSRRHAMIKSIKAALALTEDEILIPFSAQTKEGVDEVWKIITAMLKA